MLTVIKNTVATCNLRVLFAFKDTTIQIHFCWAMYFFVLVICEKCCIIHNSLLKSVNFHLWTKYILLVRALKEVSGSISEECHLKDLISWCTQVTGCYGCLAPEVCFCLILCLRTRFGFKFVVPLCRRNV